MYSAFLNIVRKVYGQEGFIPLHAPVFNGNEKKYLNDCIDSTFVSSVGKYVDDFEIKLAKFCGAKYAVVTSNGTSALHIALIVAGVKQNDLVITQPLSFIATCNAINYIGAEPAFVDVDLNTLGMCSIALKEFLSKECEVKNNECYHKKSGRRISACVPMHTFGFPCKIDEIKSVCDEFHITLIEDAAESIGSYYKRQHTGTFGALGILSFNGNKTITSGGGGAIITNDESLARRAKYLTTQAKVPHAWEFNHDEIGYNYRMPNINAALAIAQLEQLDVILDQKRKMAKYYAANISKISDLTYFMEPKDSVSNYWLNVVLLKNRQERDSFLKFTNENGVMTRPAWTLMNKLPMFSKCICSDLKNSVQLEDTLVNIPSSAININE